MSTLLQTQPTTTGHNPVSDRAHDVAPDLRAVPNHRTLAVVCALLCFSPFGVAAVVQAGHVETRLALRDLAGARRASRTVVRLCWASAMSSMSFLAMIAMCAQGYSSVR